MGCFYCTLLIPRPQTKREHFYLLGVWVYTNMDYSHTTSEGYWTYGIYCDYHRHRLEFAR